MREQDQVVGHAVRAMYMYSAMADLAAELGDASLKRACESLWADVMASKIYITSGLGTSAANEGFTEAYDLPNATAYAETCASVALMFWAQRMLHLDLDGRYAECSSRRSTTTPSAASPATASTISTPTPSTATAGTSAGPGTLAPAAP